MANALFDWVSIQQRAADDEPIVAALSSTTVNMILDALAIQSDRWRWGQPSDSDWNEIDYAVSTALDEVMTPAESEGQLHIGALIRYFDVSGQPTLPAGCVACDGGTYARVDYPLLYEYLDNTSSPLIQDADTFETPDLANGSVTWTGVGSVATAWALVAGGA